MTGHSEAGGAPSADAREVDGLRATAEQLATSGGDVARSMLDGLAAEGLDPRSKSSATDPVTVIDTEVEEHLRATIAGQRPGDVVLGEEGGQDSPDAVADAEAGGPDRAVAADGSDRVRWVVDPVDGTVNLLYGIPFTAVSVAAEVGGVVVAGAVHNIVTRETWAAGLGQGATLRHPDGAVTDLATSSRDDVSLALVGTGFGYDAALRAEQGAVVAALLPRVRDIRRCGSAALDLCMVASGRLDAYYERGLKQWDHAAGALIAAEAGALVTVSHDPAFPTTAAAPGVADRFLEVLADAVGPLSS